MDQKGVEMPSRYLDLKGLGPWKTWPNRFAILDAKYCSMMYNRTSDHGLYTSTPYESSNHSSNHGSRADGTYYDNSLLGIENQLLPMENNARMTHEFEQVLAGGSTTINGPSFPSSNTHVSSGGFTTGNEPDLRLNDGHSAQHNKPQAKSSRGPLGVALNAERTVIGASYTLSLLQNTLDDGMPLVYMGYAAKPRRETNSMALLSTVARGMCRRPGEVLALCLEVQRNVLTAITQNQLYGDDAERGLRTMGENEGTYLPVEANVQKYV